MDHGEPTGQRGMCVRPEKTRWGGVVFYCGFVCLLLKELQRQSLEEEWTSQTMDRNADRITGHVWGVVGSTVS